MAITFQNNGVRFRLANKTALKSWIREVVAVEKKHCGDLNFVFTTDEELYRINVEFLAHATYTDIITFDSTEGNRVSGDIVISIDRVRENAALFKTTFENELNRVLIHGVLHLCGYKDKTKKQMEQMRDMENKCLQLLTRRSQ